VGNRLYGATSRSGSTDRGYGEGTGTIFRIDTDGSNFASLYFFTTNNQGGVNPEAGLVTDGTNLFGTTAYGGAGYGTVFMIDTNGSGYTNLHVFTNGPDGWSPVAGLVLSQGVLYGSAGVIFKLNTDGSGFTNLHTFSPGTEGFEPSELIISGDSLYGTAEGGSWSPGTVFKVNTDGSGFTVLHSFYSALDPWGGLTLCGNTLYGTTVNFYDFSPPPYGTLFKVDVDGTSFVTLYGFTRFVEPHGDLVSSGGILYGTTYGYGIGDASGSGDGGTVFALNLAVPLRSTVLNGNMVLNWDDPSFQLQGAPTAVGPFCNIPGATSPYTNTAVCGQQFFRLQHQ
jgi:uncharacterized repeat protein (TIGR03803 family)